MSTCQYCNNTFNTKRNLDYHIKTAKYCLKKRNVQPDISINCKYCQKVFYHKRYLSAHEEKCNIKDRLNEQNEKLTEQNQTQKETIIKLTTLLDEHKATIEKYENQHKATIERYENQHKATIERYESQIRDLTSRLENVAVKGATKPTNTNIIKLECLTDDHLKKCAELLTSKDILSVGALAEFASKNTFKDRVVVSDQSRKTLTYKNTEGKLTKDPKGKQLAIKFFMSIKDKESIMKETRDNIMEELKADRSPAEIQDIFNRMNEIISIEKGLKTVPEREEDELKEIFINKLCNFLPNE
jgi:uncharacterized coiled-coil protein SlyX